MSHIFIEKIYYKSGCPIHYWVVNYRSSDWLVFLHGAGSNHYTFSQQLKIIPSNYNIIMWDARGHGKSRPIGSDFSFNALIEDIIEIMDKENCASATIVGHSLGGNIAQEIAFRYPNRVTKLVLIDCMCNTKNLWLLGKLGNILTSSILNLLPWKTIVKKFSQLSSIDPEIIEYVERSYREIGREDFIKIFTAATTCYHYEKNYRINKPILLLCGEFDKIRNIKKISYEWSNEENNCELYFINNAGHNSHQDNPEEVNRLLLNYL